ncbi:hypothetical protein [Lysobacter sp. HA35]
MKWPPLVDDGRVPDGVAARDFVLTFAAWCVLIALGHDLIAMSHYWLALVFGRVPPTPPWPAGTLLVQMTPYLRVVAILVAWLLFLAALRWRRLVRVGPSLRVPLPVNAVDYGQHFGVDAATRDVPQSSKCMTVRMQGRTVVRVTVDANDRASS